MSLLKQEAPFVKYLKKKNQESLDTLKSQKINYDGKIRQYRIERIQQPLSQFHLQYNLKHWTIEYGPHRPLGQNVFKFEFVYHNNDSFQILVLKKIIFNISFLDHNYCKPLICIWIVPYKIKGWGAIRAIYDHILNEYKKILDPNFVCHYWKNCSQHVLFIFDVVTLQVWLIYHISWNFVNISMLL